MLSVIRSSNAQILDQDSGRLNFLVGVQCILLIYSCFDINLSKIFNLSPT